MSRLKVALLGLAALLLAVAGLVTTTVLRTAAQFTVECAASFEATVRQGPSADFALSGDLVITVDPIGGVTGELTTEEEDIPVVGHIDGRAINLVLTLPDDAYLFAVGTGLAPVASEDCGGIVGGSFVGPADGDSGDWYLGDR